MLAEADQRTPAALPGRILVVDDEQRILRFVVRGLHSEGLAVDSADNGADGLRMALEGGYDLVILDLLMPGMDGASVLGRLVAKRPAQAVLVLSCLTATATKVRCLEAGAEDYLAKPFSLEELLARVRAVLRRRRRERGDQLLRLSDLVVDRLSLEVSRGGRRIDLTRREFELLLAFMHRPRQVLRREELLARVWGYDFATDTNVVEVYVLYLRRKLEAGGEPRLLHTVRGAGYVLRDG